MADALANPFTGAQPVDQANQATQDAAKAVEDFWPKFNKSQQEAQLGKAFATKTAADAKVNISKNVQTQTDDFTKTIQPLLQKQSEIAARKIELQGMNPIKRMLHSYVDRNYDMDALDSMDKAITGGLQAAGQVYSTNMASQDNRYKAVDKTFEGNMNLWEQRDRNNQQDFQLMQQNIGVHKEVADTAYNALVQQDQIRGAQLRLAQQTLGNMTQQKMFEARTQARKNGGKVMVDGAELTDAQLTHGLNAWDEEETGLKTRHVLLASQQLDLAQKQEDNILRNMSPERLQQVAQDGGKYRGQQFDMHKVASYLQDAKKTQDILVQNQMSMGTSDLTKAQIQRTVGYQDVLDFKTKALFGQMSPEDQYQSDTIKAKNKIYADGLIAAQKAGTEPAYIAKYGTAFQDMHKSQLTSAAERAKKFGGGNKDKEAFAYSYLSGDSPSPEIVSRGLIAISQTGLPVGVRLPADMVGAKKTADDIVNKYARGSQKGLGDQFKLTPEGEKQRVKAMSDELTRTLTNSYGTKKLNDFRSNAWEIAQTATDEHGLPFAFTRVPKDVYDEAVSYGSQKAIELGAAKAGIKDPKQFVEMLKQGPGGEIAKQAKIANPTFNYKDVTSYYVSAGDQNTLWALKHNPKLTQDQQFDAARSFVEFATHPKVMQGIIGAADTQKHGNLYEFGMSNLSSAGIDSTLLNSGNRLRQSYNHVLLSDKEVERASSHATLHNPWGYANATLAHVDGITPQERNDLMKFLQDPATASAFVRSGPAGGTKTVGDAARFAGDFARYGYGMTPTNGAIDQLITGGVKFSDPYLESIRKKAAAQWPKARAGTKSILESLQDEPKPPPLPEEDTIVRNQK